VKKFTCLAEKKILFRITVLANSKTEAIKKIREGKDLDAIPLNDHQGGYMLSGGGNITQ